MVGQPDFISNLEGSDNTSFNRPKNIESNGSQYFILDADNSRIMVYNSQPVTSSAVADFVLGQNGFGEISRECDATSLNRPEGLSVTDNKLLVTDSFNHRVLVWTLPITANAQAADMILGQASFNTCVKNDDDQDGIKDESSSARTFDSPSGIWSDGQRVVINDEDNNRSLVWNTFPTENFQSADLVLGQSNFTNNAPNDNDQDGVEDSISAQVLNRPHEGVNSNGVQLCIADYDNSRVLIWNEFPTESFQPADVVLGQQNMTLGKTNDDNGDGIRDDQPTARTMYYPTGCRFYNNKLYVSDRHNFRILGFSGQ